MSRPWPWLARPFALALLFALAFPTQAATVRCDGCDASRRQSLAEDVALTTTLGEPVYVIDMAGGAVDKFLVQRSIERETGEVITSVERVDPEPDVIAYLREVNAFNQAMQQTDGTFWEDNLPGSVYEDMTNPRLHYNLQLWLIARPVDLFQRFLTFLQTLNPVSYFNPGSARVVITVRFPDGSKAVYTYDPATKAWERVKGSERDSNNNVVPVAPSDFAGPGGGERTFDFTRGNDQDLIRFLQLAQMFGIPITGSTGNRKIVCISIAGGKYECRAVTI